MIQKADPSGRRAGVDVGATLAKLVVRRGDGRTRFRLLPAYAIERLAREIESTAPERVGLTGGGSAALARLLGTDTARTPEFDAWRQGAGEMLREGGLDPAEPFLLVSVGTGTSVMLVRGARVERVGGTALGGGTLTGLGAALLGSSRFGELAGLALEGDRRTVDLLVSEIYPESELPLPGEVNAASFAKLADARNGARPHDLAHALMGLVGENVGLVCTGLARAAGVGRVVYGGTTLRGNPALVEILESMARAGGLEPVFLPHGEFTGALGALVAAEV